MFHFMPESPARRLVGRVTPGQEVDSPRSVTTPGGPCDGRVHLLQTAPPRGSPAAVDVRGPAAVRARSSRGRASRRRRPPAARRRGTPGSQYSALATRKLRTSGREVENVACPSRVARRGAGRSARRAVCRTRSGPERPGVLGEVGGHPVHDTPMPAWCRRRPGTGSRRGARTGSRGVVRGHLVAPGSAERVLGDRQELPTWVNPAPP